jgi:hypothetical protein
VTGMDEAVDTATEALFPAPTPPPPRTGDPLVDEAVDRLHRELAADPGEHAAAGSRVLQALQARLQDLGPE